MDNYRQELLALAEPLSAETRTHFLAFIDAVESELWLEATRRFHSLWSAGLRGDAYRRLQEILNPVLRGRERELTSHGITRSFRFWSSEEKVLYLTDALSIVRLMKNNISQRVCICFGTALAVGRANDLIPHDDDIDTLICLPKSEFPTYNAAATHVISQLPNTDYVFSQPRPYLIHARKPKSGTKIDIFVGLDEDGYIAVFPGPRRKIAVKDVFPTCERELFGVNLPCPGLLESYLSKVYGETWAVPNPLFSHNWSESPHSDLFAEGLVPEVGSQTIVDDKRNYWNGFYDAHAAGKLALPSQFAAFVAQEAAQSLIIDVGCGTGRDSFFFARHGLRVEGLDGSIAAIESCQRTQESSRATGISFKCATVGQPEFLASLQAIRASHAGSVVVYARFLLHALTKHEESAFFSDMASTLQRGDRLALEYRTIRDAARHKATPAHYRRYINPSDVSATARRLGFVPDYAVEGLGFAKYGEDDAYVARCILRKV